MMRRAALLGLLAAGIGAATASVAAGTLEAAIGGRLFRRAWLPAPVSTRSNAGLGPLFSARSCAACHGGLDRQPLATAPDGTVAGDGLVMRVSDFAGRPDPVYGRQLQPASVPGVEPKIAALVRGPDGHVAPTGLGYGPLGPGTRSGALLAPALRGLGALASVPDEAVIAGAAAGGGRVSWLVVGGERRVGRFGPKAGEATLAGQVERAFALDLGLSTAGRPGPEGDCPPALAACRAAPAGGAPGEPEIAPALVSSLAAFLAAVPPPPPPPDDPDGARLFAAAGCAGCHRPSLPGTAGPVRAFTDLLLHDLGPALDGGATEPGILPTEWRTAPLWGLGGALARGAPLLHDGRAATLPAAVALHGGEAALARNAFAALTETDRRRLLAYLDSL